MRSVSAFLVAAGLFALPVSALQVPVGTRVEIRFKGKVSSQTAKARDAVEAVVIAPVAIGGEFLIPAGAIARRGRQGDHLGQAR